MIGFLSFLAVGCLKVASRADKRRDFGVEFTHTHLTDLAFGGFDPDAQAQNGTFRGT
jgi:hypothetical protein